MQGYSGCAVKHGLPGHHATWPGGLAWLPSRRGGPGHCPARWPGRSTALSAQPGPPGTQPSLEPASGLQRQEGRARQWGRRSQDRDPVARGEPAGVVQRLERLQALGPAAQRLTGDTLLPLHGLVSRTGSGRGTHSCVQGTRAVRDMCSGARETEFQGSVWRLFQPRRH